MQHNKPHFCTYFYNLLCSDSNIRWLIQEKIEKTIEDLESMALFGMLYVKCVS